MVDNANELIIKTLPTYTATIYVGLQQPYNRHVHPIQTVEKICEDYCDLVGLCVTVTPTKFIYTYGKESGAIVGLIHYPRFPDDKGRVKRHALKLAELLKEECKQRGVSVVLPDETIWIADPEVTLENEPTDLK
jgi:hypothetical protein